MWQLLTLYTACTHQGARQPVGYCLHAQHQVSTLPGLTMGRRSQGVAFFVHLEAELHVVQLEAAALKTLGAQPTCDAMQAQHVPHHLECSHLTYGYPGPASSGTACLAREKDSQAADAVLLLFLDRE